MYLHGRVDAMRPRFIRTGDDNASPLFRITGNGNRFSLQIRIMRLFDRGIKTIHIDMKNNSAGHENRSSFRFLSVYQKKREHTSCSLFFEGALYSINVDSLTISTSSSANFSSSSIGMRSFFVWISSYPTHRLTVGMPKPLKILASLPPQIGRASCRERE